MDSNGNFGRIMAARLHRAYRRGADPSLVGYRLDRIYLQYDHRPAIHRLKHGGMNSNHDVNGCGSAIDMRRCELADRIAGFYRIATK